MTTRTKRRKIVYMRVDEIAPADVNPKDHDEPGIAASMRRFGFIESMVLDERTQKLVGGHGRRDELLRGHADGSELPEGIDVDPKDGMWIAPVSRGWASRNDDEAKAAGIALNRIGERGGWHVDDLDAALRSLSSTPLGLDGLGFTMADLDDLPGALGMRADLDALDRQTEKGANPSTGDLLALVDVTIDDPTAVVELGDVWKLGAHTLVCIDVMTGHGTWAPLLSADAVFCPYPGPYIVLAAKADAAPLVLVQPDPYIAGHIIDKWQSIHRKQKPKKQ